MATEFKLDGIASVKKALMALDNATTKKVIEKTFRIAARPLVKKAKELAPPDKTGNLRESIGIFVSRAQDRKANLAAGIWVGPRIRGRYEGYHAHLIEFGTDERKPKHKKVLVFEYNGVKVFAKKTKGMKPRPFMGPAYDQTVGKVEDGVFDNLQKVYLKEINRVR